MNEKEIPKYLQLKKEIMSWLLSGELKPNEQMPSEHEIAGRFRLSRQTVRRALAELVQEGYLYKRQGKGTFAAEPGQHGTESKTIGMITTYISDYIFPHIVRGAEAALRERGYNLLLSSTDNDKDRERESLERVLTDSVQGLIIEPTKSALGNPNLNYYLAMHARQIPVVMINARYPELDFPCLRVDDEAGGYMAAEHLIRLGHRQIAGFFKTDDLQGVYRMKGFMTALKKYRIPIDMDTVIAYSTEDKWTKPYETLLAMLQSGKRPTGVVCYNDELAVRLLEAVRRLKLNVPGDLSIVGFDDSSLSVATEVKLTTIAHPKMQMGIDAAAMLVEMIKSKELTAGEDKVYEPVWIERESTRKVDG